MRVLHVINDLRVGGAETLVADLVPALRTQGIAVEAAALAPTRLFVEDRLKASGAPLHMGPYGIRDPRNAGWLKRLAQGFDLVHVHLWPAQLWGALAGLRTPIVATEHNTLNRRRDSPLFQPLDRWMYGRFAHVVCVSAEAERLLVEWVPGLNGRTRVIVNGLALERYQAVEPAAPDLPRPLLVCAARLEPQKDIPTLLDAMALLPEGSLAIAGDGPLRPALEQQAVRLGISARVKFLGRIPNIPELLAAADLYVQPSLYEGFPRATGEALATGLPLIVSDGPGFTELVGDAAWRFPVGDSKALASVIQTALKNPEQGRARSQQRTDGLSIEACATAHISLYRHLLTEQI